MIPLGTTHHDRQTCPCIDCEQIRQSAIAHQNWVKEILELQKDNPLTQEKVDDDEL